MKVSELIAKLQEMDPDALVYVNKTDCCEDFREAEFVWPTVESKRDYSKRYNDPDAYISSAAVRVE